MEKICEICGKPFEAKATNQKYCSDLCRTTANLNKSKARYHKKISETNKTIGGKKKCLEKRCRHCGTPFRKAGNKAFFCSDECRRIHSYLKAGSLEEVQFNINYSEKIRLMKPTEQEIKQSKELLEDFSIYVDMPEFEKLSDLLTWRKNIIDNSFKH